MSDSAWSTWIPAKERAYLLAAVGGGAKLLDHTYAADSVIRELAEALREIVDIWDDLHGRGSDIYPYDGMTIHPAVRALKRVDALMGETDE